VFIRGDNAAYYAFNLKNLLDGNEDSFTRIVIQGLLSDLRGCIIK
jgi:hypothetical protein